MISVDRKHRALQQSVGPQALDEPSNCVIEVVRGVEVIANQRPLQFPEVKDASIRRKPVWVMIRGAEEERERLLRELRR